MSLRITVILAILLSSVLAWGQPLSSRVPADAVVYIGWQGTDSMPPGYDKSNLKALVESSKLRQVFNECFPKLIEKVAQRDPNAAEALTVLRSVGGPLWRHPTAIYFAGLDLAAGFPRPKLGIICQAGNEADGMLQLFTAWAANVQNVPIPVKPFKQGDLVGIIIGYDTENEGIAGSNGGPKALATNASFTAAMAQVNKDPMLAAYVDTAAIRALVEQLIKMGGDPAGPEMFAKGCEALGLNGLKQIILTAGFDGPDWSTQCFIAAPSPRTGLLTMLEAQPVSNEMLRAIPKTATWMAAGRFDLAKLVTEIRTIAGKVDPDAQQKLDMVLGAAQMALVMDVQKGLLEPLGDEWAIYVDPSISGNGLIGLTALNRLRQPAEAQKALNKLELFLDNAINGQLSREKLHIGFEQTKAGNVTLHYVALPLVSPSWAIKDGILYAALYPQIVAGVLEDPAARTGSILDNPAFQAVRTRLGVQNAASISFSDLPAASGEMYQFLLAGSQLLLGATDLFGVKTPPMVVPPLYKLRQHLTPAGSASWTDSTGWHMKSVSPFPGSQLLASQGGLAVGSAAVAGGIIAPALNASREKANRVKSASNLRQIGQGCMLFANDHPGSYPADLGTLHMEDDLHVEVFLSPAGHKRMPSNLMAARSEERAAWINNHSDYVYLGASLKPSDSAEMILAYEKPELNGHQGLNVLFNDGHVEWMSYHAAMEAIQKQTAQAPAAK